MCDEFSLTFVLLSNLLSMLLRSFSMLDNNKKSKQSVQASVKKGGGEGRKDKRGSLFSH